MVTELFSNAIRHGPVGGRVLVGYCLWRQGVRLVVCDGGPGTPRLVEGDALAEGGRGLHVVDSLAARWGSFRPVGAQAVWCDFGQPLHAAPGDAWAWLHLVLSVCNLSCPARPVGIIVGGYQDLLTNSHRDVTTTITEYQLPSRTSSVNLVPTE